ncbi:hypothetical protein IWQ61_007169 [Dispira simplex]|nr:hypothetical protein IWQ61_007169 [Dispira simplex]
MTTDPNNDSSSEYEEYDEEFYVVCDLHQQQCTSVESDANSSAPYSLVGLETETPYLEYNGVTYRGDYEDSIGTQLIFEPGDPPRTDSDRPNQDIESMDKTLDFVDYTTKVLRFYPVILKPKEKPEAS